MTPGEQSLLGPTQLAELEALRRMFRSRTRSRDGGEHVSKRRGSSAEFLEHRTYNPGDDVRRLDWSATARTGTPVIKLFRADQDLHLRIAIDTSASLLFGTPPKFEVVKRLAAALGYLALANGERAQVISVTDHIETMRDPVRGRGGLGRLLTELDQIRPKGEGALGPALESIRGASKIPGVVAVFSDFLDPSDILGAGDRLAAAGNELLLVQVLAPEEVRPRLLGDVELVDLETGSTIDLTVDDSVLEGYEARLAHLQNELAGLARRVRGHYICVETSDPVMASVRRIVEAANFR